MFLQSVIIPLFFFCLNPFDVDAKGCEKYGFIISDIEHVKQSWPHPNAVVVTFENTDVPLCLPYGKGRVDPTVRDSSYNCHFLPAKVLSII